MNLKLTLVLSMMMCPLIANQVRVHPKQQITRSKKVDQPDVYRSGVVDDEEMFSEEMFNEDILDIEVDENINTESLIPLWARLANKVAAPFFVLYNNFSKWWNTKQNDSRLKKSRYMKRF